MRSLLKHSGFAALAIFGISLTAFHGASQAMASTCSEEGIFWANWTSSGDWQRQAYGSNGVFMLRNRDYNQNCTDPYFVAGSTAFLNAGNFVGTYAEVGWEQIGFPLEWSPFGEWFMNHVEKGRAEFSWPCTPVVGDDHEWQVANVSGTTKFNLRISCLDGNGYHTIGTTDALTTSSHGIPEGETFRFGGTATGMMDDHHGLTWENSSGTWQQWHDPRCQTDSATNWHGVKNTSTEYHTEQGSGGC